MDSATHQALLRDTNRLRSLLSPCGTRSVLGSVQAYLLHRANDLDFDGGLASPARQLAFLLGLLLSTPEPAEPKAFASWDRAVELLERIFRSYDAPMWPTEAELGHMDAEWRRIRQVAGQALLHYHNTGLMASTYQIAARVRHYVAPFDAAVRDAWDISATDALAICDWLSDRAQLQLDRLVDHATAEKDQRFALIEEWEKQSLTIEQLGAHAATTPYESTFRDLIAQMDALGSVRKDDLVQQFGDSGAAFWNVFSIARGGVELTYLTETNPVDTHPLILVDDATAFLTSVNGLYEAVLIGAKPF